MTYQIKLDRDQMERTAKLLAEINPVDSADGFYRTMEQMAYQMTKPGYCGTGGFYLTMFEPSYARGELHMLVSIQPYTVERYVRAVASANEALQHVQDAVAA